MKDLRFRLLELIDNYEHSSPLGFWILIYFLVIVLSGILSFVIPFSLKATTGIIISFDLDSARYILSSIIQSQAAIISIVVSLTLIAVQFTAQSYSTRVIEVFKKDPALWAMLGMYSFSIFFNTILLSTITKENTINPEDQVYLFNFSIFLFIGLLITLIPHIRVTMNHLNGRVILKKLLTEITIENFKEGNDIFQPVFEFIYSTINKNDYGIMNESISSVCEKYKNLILECKDEKIKNKISFYIFDDLKRCGFILTNKEEEPPTVQISSAIISLYNFGFEKKEQIILESAIDTLTDLAEKGLSKKFGFVISNIFTFFEINYPKCLSILNNKTIFPMSLKKIAIKALYSNEDNYAKFPIIQLRKYIDKNISTDEDFVNSSIEALTKITKAAIIMGKDGFRDSTIKKVYSTLMFADEHDMKDIKDFAILEITQLIMELGDQVPTIDTVLMTNSDTDKENFERTWQDIINRLTLCQLNKTKQNQAPN